MGNTLCTCHEIDSQGDRIESSELGKLYRKVSIVRSAQTASIKVRVHFYIFAVIGSSETKVD